MEIAKQMTLAERLFMFVLIISFKWVDGKSRKFWNIARTTLKFTLLNEFLGGWYVTLIWKKLEVLGKIFTTERSSDLVEYHVEAIKEKINIFDYDEPDFVALKVDEDEHILYNGQLAENEN